MFFWTFLVLFWADFLLFSPACANEDPPQGVTEHPGGIIKEGIQVLYKSKSPYWLRNDIIVERNAQLVIEAGVEVRFEPMIGLTVRGILKAEVRRL